jgi:hypothetical protein
MLRILLVIITVHAHVRPASFCPEDIRSELSRTGLSITVRNPTDVDNLVVVTSSDQSRRFPLVIPAGGETEISLSGPGLLWFDLVPFAFCQELHILDRLANGTLFATRRGLDDQSFKHLVIQTFMSTVEAAPHDDLELCIDNLERLVSAFHRNVQSGLQKSGETESGWIRSLVTDQRSNWAA